MEEKRFKRRPKKKERVQDERPPREDFQGDQNQGKIEFNPEQFVPWFEKAEKLDAKLKIDPTAQLNFNVEVLKREAKDLYEKQVQSFEQEQKKFQTSDDRWLGTVLRSGTVSDKMAAMTMLVQKSPFHQLRSLDVLMGHTKKKGKREALAAVETAKDLFLNSLMPNRPLRYFHEHPFGATGRTDQHLIYWYFEDQIKVKYLEIIQLLQQFSTDILTFYKGVAIKYLFELIMSKPEQNELLLSSLINKMGDPEKQIASKAVYHLSLYVQDKPMIKDHIIKEVERFMARSNLSISAEYNAINFLNQILLSHKSPEIPKRLINIYFGQFKALVTKDEMDNKILSALLTGIHRAFPFTNPNDPVYEEHLHTLFKVVHVATFNKSTQALVVLHKLMEYQPKITDRFYRALYEKLHADDLTDSSSHSQFLQLIGKSLLADDDLRRVKAFAKRLLQVCAYQKPPFICASLVLLTLVFTEKAGLRSMIDQPEEKEVESQNQTEDKNKKNKKKNKVKESKDDHSSRGSVYDPLKREPQYSNADKTCLWELIPFLNHFHPSVAKFALNLHQVVSPSYGGDPFEDFSLMSFLDRFVYKNAKKADKETGISAMQKRKTSQSFTVVNDPSFINQEAKNIREDCLFFYKYFTEKAKKEKKKPKPDGEDAEEDADDKGELEDVEDAAEPGEFDYDKLDEMSDSEPEDVAEDEDDGFDESAFLRELQEEEKSDEEDGEVATGSSAFAAAEEFAHLLESAGDGLNPQQKQWEEKGKKRRGRERPLGSKKKFKKK